jgi:hypothetical protein
MTVCSVKYLPFSDMFQANSQFKFKFYNGETRLCRKTILAPVFDIPIDRLVGIARSEDSQESAHQLIGFSAGNKVFLMCVYHQSLTHSDWRHAAAG